MKRRNNTRSKRNKLNTSSVEDPTKLPEEYTKGGAIYVESEKTFFSYQSGTWVPMFFDQEKVKQYNRNNNINNILNESS